MIGAFVQHNSGTLRGRRFPVGYIVQEDGCWTWVGTTNGVYGTYRIPGTGRSVYAHRMYWEAIHGPVPDGLECDHLCNNPMCVRPDHIRVVTHRENLMRSRNQTALNVRKTHCPYGHEYTTENTRVRRGKRECRECVRAYDRKRRPPGSRRVYRPDAPIAVSV